MKDQETSRDLLKTPITIIDEFGSSVRPGIVFPLIS